MRGCLHILLVMICVPGSRVAHSGETYCKRALLDDADRAALFEHVRQITENEPDPQSLSICRRRSEFFAELSTFRVAIGDGSERWNSVACLRSKAFPVWKCGASKLRTFHAQPYADMPGIWVLIPPDASLFHAKRRALQAFGLIAGSGQLGSCGSHGPPPKSFAELKALLAGGDGLVELFEHGLETRLIHGRFQLFIAQKDHSSDHALLCWDILRDADIIVTPNTL